MWQTAVTTREFFKGNYETALARAGAGERIAPGIRAGCLVFLGRIPEAEQFLREHRPFQVQLAMANFFLAVGYTRQSNYPEAKAGFARNCFQFRNSADPYSKFFAIQGIAFYRYYCGRYQQSMKLAERAASLAAQAGFSYGQMIALDAFAHSAVNFGEVKLGLATFRSILRLARSGGGGGFAAGARISATISEAAFSVDTDASVRELEACRRLHATDTYSRAEVNLELIRQLTLRAQINEARTLLDETYGLVHKNRNRRQAATTNLRAAYLSFLEGDLHQALHLIRTSEMNLHREVDLLFIAQLKGLEAKILRALGRAEEAEEVEQVCRQETARLQSAAVNRIRAREHGGQLPVRIGEDPLGDLLDHLRKSNDPVMLGKAVKAGLNNLLREHLPVPPGGRAIVFGVIDGAALLANRGNIRVETGFSAANRQILRAIGCGRGSKERLIREIWGYQYHPLRHDKLLYSAIRKLRKLLAADWIQLTENGYVLAPDVRLVLPDPARAARVPAPPPAPTSELENFRDDLNLRQNEILEALVCGRRLSWRPQDVRHAFRVSTMTATRDLSGLREGGNVRRVGKGRGTYYVLSPRETSRT